MGIEISDNSWDIPDFSTPERIDIAYYDRLFWSKKQETISFTCANQQIAFERTLEEKLVNWINIKSQSDYDYFKNLLEKYRIAPSLWSTTFNSINWGVWITLKKVGNLFKVYNNPPSSPWDSIAEQGEIKNGDFTKTGTFISLFSDDDLRGDNSGVPKDIPECEAPVQKPKPGETLETPHAHTEYKIQRWDSLWKIIKENYNLTKSDNPDRDIWNIIEKLKKYPKNKKSRVIKKDINGTIHFWDTLYLPQMVNFKYKWWVVEKKFLLVGKIPPN